MTRALVCCGALGLAALAPSCDARASARSRPAGIRWESGFAAALESARATGRPLLVDFWAEWCGWCHTFDRTTYVAPEVVRLSRDFVAVKVDTEGSEAEIEIALRYRVSSLPTVLFLSPRGTVVFRLSGYQRPAEFAETLVWVKAEGQRIAAWERAIAANPRDAKALMGLGLHQLDNESFEEGRDLLVRAMAADGTLPASDRKRLRYALGVLRSMERKYTEAEAVLKEGLALVPLDREADPPLLYALGRLYIAWGRQAEALVALRRLVADFPESPNAESARRALSLMSPSS